MPAERTAAPQTAEPASAAEPQDDRFAAGFGGEDESAAARPEPTPAKPAFDPKTADWYRTKESDVPDDWKPYQRQLKSQLAEQTRANQEASELRKEIAALRQQVSTRDDSQLATAIEKLAPAQDPYADLKQRLDPEEQGAIDVVREILKREMAGQVPDLNPVQQEVQQLKAALIQMAHYMQSQQQSGQVDELRAAYEKHGESLQDVAPNIRALIQTPKPGTNRNWTVLEAADLLLGAAATSVEDARQVDKAERNRAKREAAGSSGISAGKGNGPLTDADLKAQLAELGFRA